MSLVSRSCRSCDASLADDAAFCHRCGAVAEAEAPAGRAPGGSDAARARVQRALGSGYQLRHLLGRGGFADVYAAWDVRLRLTRQSVSEGRATTHAFEWAPSGRAAVDTAGRRLRVEVVRRPGEPLRGPARRAARRGRRVGERRGLGARARVGGRRARAALRVGARRAARPRRHARLASGLPRRGGQLRARALPPAGDLLREWRVPGDFSAGGASGVLGLIVSSPPALALLTAVVAAAESLARAHRPRLVLGLHELAAGRLGAPELPGAALFGYGGGMLVAGVAVAVGAGADALFGSGGHVGVPVVLEYGSATLAFAAQIGFALAGALLLLFTTAIGAARRLPPWIAAGWPVAVYALLVAPHRGAEVAGWLVSLVVAGGTAAVVWRLGAVAGACALLVCLTARDAVAMLRAGTPGTAGPGAASLLCLAALLAAALWRGGRPARARTAAE